MARTISQLVVYRCQECRKNTAIQRAQPLQITRSHIAERRNVFVRMEEEQLLVDRGLLFSLHRSCSGQLLKKLPLIQRVSSLVMVSLRWWFQITDHNSPQKHFGTFPRTTSSSTRPAVHITLNATGKQREQWELARDC